MEPRNAVETERSYEISIGDLNLSVVKRFDLT